MVDILFFGHLLVDLIHLCYILNAAGGNGNVYMVDLSHRVFFLIPVGGTATPLFVLGHSCTDNLVCSWPLFAEH